MRFVTTSTLLLSAISCSCGQLVGTPHSASSLVPSIGSALGRAAVEEVTDLAADPNLEDSPAVLHIRGVDWGRRAEMHYAEMHAMMASDGRARPRAGDLVVRITSMHTRWIDMRSADPSQFAPPVLDPKPLDQDAVLAFRGASYASPGLVADADALDAFGDPRSGTDAVVFLNNDRSWKPSLAELKGARFVQMRATLVSNAITGRLPSTLGLGVALTRD